MRLRPLTEAECYARCYGGRHEESVSVVPLLRNGEDSGPEVPSRDRGEPAEVSEAA